MTDMKRHVGRIINTDRRCVVVFMQLPDDPKFCLIVDTDALPDRIHSALMDIVEGEAQRPENANLYELLNRRLMPNDRSTVIQYLHQTGYLQKQSVENIMMYPVPNMPIRLTDILSQIGQPMRDKMQVSENAAEVKHNQHQATQQVEKDHERVQMARNLIVEAELLEGEANAKRKRAHEMAPSLRNADPIVPSAQSINSAVESTVEKRGPGRPKKEGVAS